MWNHNSQTKRHVSRSSWRRHLEEKRSISQTSRPITDNGRSICSSEIGHINHHSVWSTDLDYQSTGLSSPEPLHSVEDCNPQILGLQRQDPAGTTLVYYKYVFRVIFKVSIINFWSIGFGISLLHENLRLGDPWEWKAWDGKYRTTLGQACDDKSRPIPWGASTSNGVAYATTR